MPKVIKKEAHGLEEVLTSRSRMLGYLSEHFKIVVIATAAISAVFISYSLWTVYSGLGNRKASEAFYNVMKTYKAAVDPSGAAPDTFKTEEEKERAVASKFAEVARLHKGTSYEGVALLYAANGHYNLKEYDKAIELYNKLLYRIDREDPALHGNIMEVRISPGPVRDAALEGLAYSCWQKGDAKKAVEIMASLASDKQSHLRSVTLLTLAGLYEKSGDKKKSLETYESFINDFPESPKVPEVKERVERLKG